MYIYIWALLDRVDGWKTSLHTKTESTILKVLPFVSVAGFETGSYYADPCSPNWPQIPNPSELSCWVAMIPGLHHHSRLLVGNAVHSHLEKNPSLLQHPEACKDAPTQLFFPGKWSGWLYNGSLLLTSVLSLHCPVCLTPLWKTIFRCYYTLHAIWAEPDHAVDLGLPSLLEEHTSVVP